MGTLLALHGVGHPEDVIFKDLSFELAAPGQPPGGTAATLHYSYRAADALDYLAAAEAATGIRIRSRQSGSGAAAVEIVASELAAGRPAVAFIDHYHYRHSPFFRLRHFRHAIVATEAAGDDFRYLDPLPSYAVDEVITPGELVVLCDSAELGEFRARTITADHSGAVRDTAEYLRQTWRSQLEANTRRMLGPDRACGAAAIRALADWLPAAGESGAEIAELGLDGPLEIGRNRAGHCLYLRRLAQLLSAPALAEAAGILDEAASSWNMVSWLRQLTMVPGLAASEGLPLSFLRRRARGVPALLRELADREEAAMVIIRDWLERSGAHVAGASR